HHQQLAVAARQLRPIVVAARSPRRSADQRRTFHGALRMRRSSWVAVITAVLLLAALAAVLVLAVPPAAPRMSQEEASRLIGQGVRALERRDTGAIMDLFTADAKILDHKAEEVRPLVARAVSEID